jgi:hypothetical protein
LDNWRLSILKTGGQYLAGRPAARSSPAWAQFETATVLGTVRDATGAVVPGAISNGAELTNLVATQTTYAGEQVSARRFASQWTSRV